ncbi:MAG: hypothetical protein JSS32_02365 [Verrucomicrobia bacterium]|nr:hypothetical protein [Verrucomicrobiota bacterium]
MKKVLLFCLLCASLSAQTRHKSPQEIQKELQTAEDQLKRAEQLFNPWYTGPLLTPSATMMPPGYANAQPYIFIVDNYANYNEDRKSVSLANNLINLNPLNILQIGITDSMDTSITNQTQTNWQDGKSGGGYGDTQVSFGFLVQEQGLYIPKMKVSISETFPTGKYQRLRPSGLDGAGGGTYATSFSFAIAKIFFWATQHPVNTRYAMSYQVSTPVKVHGYNAYGGGIGTKGVVKPGNKFNADLGIEVSIDQRWVLANDFVYTMTDQTTFTGKTTAPVGKGFSDNFSLAPAIEYNFNENLGVLGGVQFSVYGRNSLNFISAILSIEYTFPMGPWD